MKRIYLGLILLLICGVAYGAPASTLTRPYSYSSGNTILSDEVNSDFNTMYNGFNTHTHSDFTSTTSTTFTIGNDTDVDHDFIVNNGDTNNPRVRYDSGTSKWQITNDGTTYSDIPTAAAAGIKGVITGMELIWTNPEVITVNPGACEIDDDEIVSTSDTSSDPLHIASAPFWIGGTAGDDPSTWIYIYAFDGGSNVASFNFSKTAPNASDEDGNTDGILKYYSTGGVDYRCIGAVYNDGSSNATRFVQRNNLIMYDVPANLTTSTTANVWTSQDCSAAIPPISTHGLFGAYSFESGGNSELQLRPNGGTWAQGYEDGIAGTGYCGGQLECFTDSSQVINYVTDTNDSACSLDVQGFYLNIR